MENRLVIKNLSVKVGERDVVKNFSLTVDPGEIHALMGPNGSGKSSLAMAVFGHPSYEILSGSVEFDGKEIIGMTPEERARLGLFLSFQEPPEIGGVSMNVFLKRIAVELTPEASARNRGHLNNLGLNEIFLSRFLNEGFSGGEKKKSELLQFFHRSPKIAILDEIDTGLDVDATTRVAELLKTAARNGIGLILISHSLRLFDLIPPHKVHILAGGNLAVSGGREIIDAIQEKGYGAFCALAI